MKVIQLDKDVPETWLIGPAIDAIRKGELVVIPTDGMYALACHPWERQAVSKLYKARTKVKGLFKPSSKKKKIQ